MCVHVHLIYLCTQAHLYLASLQHVVVDALKAVHTAEFRPANVGAFLADAVVEAARPPPSGGFARNPPSFQAGGGGLTRVSLNYVEARAMPLITEALGAANERRPEDPVEFLADFLRNEAGRSR